MIRRLARAAVGVGVGTGLAVAPVTAYAADVDGPTTADPTAVVTTFDLGWQSTGKSTGTASHDASQDATAGDDDTSGVRPTATDVDTATPVARDDGLALEEPSKHTRTPDTRAPHDLVADADHVVVHRGDTLWNIAARTLHDGASDADVLRAVVQWHDANRDVIGPDPDVIRPGQVLRAPS
jgi:nucleoid-associated protein YgaU